MRLVLVVLVGLVVSGCHAFAGIHVARPGPSGLMALNQVSVANVWGDELLLSLPQDSLTSQASLYRIAPNLACFDVDAHMGRCRPTLGCGHKRG